MWLAAENGMFLRATRGEWMTTMPEHLNMEWVDSIKVCTQDPELNSKFENCVNFDNINLQHVFEYFTERTPRSHLELRETSLVWNYKYAGM